jgi:SAM-dependent methyltransferase
VTAVRLNIFAALKNLNASDETLPMGAPTPGTARVESLGFDEQVRELAPAEIEPVQTPACPVCGATCAIPIYALKRLPYRIAICDGCGLGRLHPPPARAAITGFYQPDYYGTAGTKFRPFVERMVRLAGSSHVRSLTEGLPRGARVLDVGCGRGVLLSALANRGFEVYGFEISEAAAVGADLRASIRIADDLREVGYPDGHFDEVIVWHVLEHLPEPRETLCEIRRIIRDGGRLAVAVPNFSSFQARWARAAWFHLDAPRHLFHFPLPALERLIEQCGFAPMSVHHFSLRQNPFGWVQSYLNRDASVPRNLLYHMLKNERHESELFDAETRRKQWAAYYIGMPIALGLSMVDAVMRQGASVYIKAVAR